jgi:multiple antibiotic resistance protein
MKIFWLCFVPMFVAVDAIGVLPMFMGFTQDVDSGRVRKILWQSVITAAVVALVFLFLGSAILELLGITVADFMVAGGVLLFIIAISDLLANEKRQRRVDTENLGAVPLGVPLITGPAVLTTSILLLNEYGFLMTSVAVLINILLAGLIFSLAEPLNRMLGKAGARILSKIAMLFLAAIAIMIIRKGVALIIKVGLL